MDRKIVGGSGPRNRAPTGAALSEVQRRLLAAHYLLGLESEDEAEVRP